MHKRFKLKEEMAVNAGGVGEYSTPRAARKKTPKDTLSPTGFESSPKPNMYSKSSKYKIADPKDRLNSKDLWKGEHLGEIKVNKPDLANTILDKLIELGDSIDLGWYFTKFNISEEGKGPLDNIRNSSRENQLALYSYLKNKKITEIKVNKPEQYHYPIKINNKQEYQKWIDYYLKSVNQEFHPHYHSTHLKYPYFIRMDRFNKETGKYSNPVFKKNSGEKPLSYLIDDIKQLSKEDQQELRIFLKDKFNISEIKDLFESHEPDPKDFPIKISSYEQAQLIGQWLQKHGYNLNIDQPPFNTKPLLNPFYIKADGNNIHFDILNESKYSQFKQSTSKPNPKQVLHKAIKEIQFKLDEVNKLIDFTSRIKGELTEGDQEIEYLKRTKDNIYKIQNRLKEVFSKLCALDEIKVNNPTTPDIDKIQKMYSELGELGSKGPNPIYYKIPNIIIDTLIPSKYKRSGHIGTYLQRLKDDNRNDILNKIYNQFQTEINKYNK